MQIQQLLEWENILKPLQSTALETVQGMGLFIIYLARNWTHIVEKITSVPQTVYVGADLEGRAQLNVHGRHEVLLPQQ